MRAINYLYINVVPSVDIPEGEWMVTEDKTTELYDIAVTVALVIAYAVMIFAFLLVFSRLLYKEHYIATDLLRSNLYLLVLPSLILSFLVVLLQSKHPHMLLATRVARRNVEDVLDAPILMALNLCAGKYRKKVGRSGKYRKERYYNKKFLLEIYISDSGDFATIKLVDYKKQDNELIYCIQRSISENLGIPDKVTPFKDLWERQNAEFREKLEYGA